MKHALVKLPNGHTRCKRFTDFNPIFAPHDPTRCNKSAMVSFARRMHTVRQTISASTPPQINLTQAGKYPDGGLSAIEYDKEIAKLDEKM